jgi:hypothetical protein
MNRAFVLATAAIAAVSFTSAVNAKSKTVRAVKAPEVAIAPVEVAQDCSRFYDVYRPHGFTWGVGPGSSVGFGTFEGALPRYPINEFPNWYGLCVNAGHYSTAGSAPD